MIYSHDRLRELAREEGRSARENFQGRAEKRGRGAERREERSGEERGEEEFRGQSSSLSDITSTFASEKTYPLDGRIRLLYQTANGTYVNPGLNKLQIQSVSSSFLLSSSSPLHLPEYNFSCRGIYSRTTASLSGNELELSSPITADGDFILSALPLP